MEKTVVGVFESMNEANQVREELIAAGFPSEQIHMNAMSMAGGTGAGMGTGTTSTRTGMDTGTATGMDATTGTGAGMGTTMAADATGDTGGYSTRGGTDGERHGHEGGISGFFKRLFGEDDDEQWSDYEDAVNRGNCIVTVDRVPEDRVDGVEDIMQRHGAVDLEERAERSGSARLGTMDTSSGAALTTPSSGTTTASGLSDEASMRPESTNSSMGNEGTRIPVVEEQLKVGKRAIQRGGVRIFSRVTETPVEESVRLREEHARVERRTVDRPATEGDMAAFKEGSIEVRETAEEPVVSKEARVVEEIQIGKETTEREETVRDTVRRTNVEVEDLPASRPTSSDQGTGKPTTR